MRLYTQTINPFAEKVANALAMKGIDFTRVVIEGAEEIKRVNPETQLLPVVEYRTERVWDSTKILEWIEERFPEPPLYAADPKTAEAQRKLATWSDTSFAWYWNRWRAAAPHPVAESLTEAFRSDGDDDSTSDPSTAEDTSPGLLGRLHGHIERTIHRTAGSDEQRREAEIMDEIAKRLDDLVGLLADRDFYYSDTPSIADLSVNGMLSTISTGPMPGSAALLAERPALVAYMARMSAAIPKN